MLEYPLDPTKQASAASFGLSYEIAAFSPASGWTHVPTQRAARQQTTLTLSSTSTTLNPDRTFDLYVYATTSAGYDRVLVVPQTAGKDGSAVAGHAASRAQYSAVKLRGADGLIGAAAGESAGFYLKLMTISPRPFEIRTLLHLGHPAQGALRHRRLQRAAGRRPR